MSCKKTIILHTRPLTTSEEQTLSKLFTKVHPFIPNYHSHQPLQALLADGDLLTIDLNRKEAVTWYKTQDQKEFNVILLASSLKRNQSQIALHALGMLEAIDVTVGCLDDLMKSLKEIKLCRSLFCCF